MIKIFKKERFNAYFLFTALAFAISAYLFIMSGNYSYVSQADVLLTPKNVKTALYIDKIKNNLVEIFDNKYLGEDSEFRIVSNGDNTLLRIAVEDNSKDLANNLMQEKINDFIGTVSDSYDVDKDLDVKIIDRNVYKKDKNVFIVSIISLLSGVALAFVLQVGLELAEKFSAAGIKRRNFESGEMSEEELKKIFDFDREKIKRLSVDFEKESEVEKDVKEKSEEKYDNLTKSSIPKKGKEAKEVSGDENITERKVGNIFKTAPTPRNLPIAEEYDVEKGATENLKDNLENNNNEKNNSAPSDEYEPTEEEFKKRLNQLLRGE